MDRIISKSITALRFPLAFLVVIEHYYPNDIVQTLPQESYDLYTPLAKFVSVYLPTFAVPLFFFISSYLFYQGIDFQNNKFTGEIYKNKIRKRIKSLLIPYLSWNLLLFLGMFTVQYITNDSLQLLEKPISEIEWMDFLSAFWSFSRKGFPIDGPLWFVRDLFVVMLFSPIIYQFVRCLKCIGVVIILCLCLLNFNLHIPYISSASICYFVLGAYFALSKKDRLYQLCQINRSISLTFIIISLIILLFIAFNPVSKHIASIICNIYSFVCVLFIWSLLYKYIEKHDFCIKDSLINSAFFVYASHKPIIYLLCITSFKVLEPCGNLSLILMMLVITSLTVIISLGMFYLIRGHFHSLSFLTGFRL